MKEVFEKQRGDIYNRDSACGGLALPARGISKPLASHQWSTAWGLGCYYTRPVCSAIQSKIAQNGLIAAVPIIANKMPPPMCRAACARLSKTGGGVRISSFGLVCVALFGLLGIFGSSSRLRF